MLSEVLLEIGLGQSARDEARIAIKLAPQDAEAYRALGVALGCDLYGRRYFRGADLDGAAAALRKAKELDPKNIFPRIALADLAQHTAGRASDAAAEYLAIRKGDDRVAFIGGNFKVVLRGAAATTFAAANANVDMQATFAFTAYQ